MLCYAVFPDVSRVMDRLWNCVRDDGNGVDSDDDPDDNSTTRADGRAGRASRAEDVGDGATAYVRAA